MATVREICKFYESVAPFYMKLDFDNIGILSGFCDATVKKAVFALDITEEVIDEAISYGAELIISHHPVIFEPLKRVVDEDIKSRKIIKLVQNNISAICLHTNLDTAFGGVNDCLMEKLGANVTGLLSPHGTDLNGKSYGISREGFLRQPISLSEFLLRIKTELNSNGLRYVDSGKPVYHIACCGGAGGGDMILAYHAGCDTYVTADLKYDHFLEAKALGLNLIDADHFCTENVVIPYIHSLFVDAFPGIESKISSVHKQTIQFY